MRAKAKDLPASAAPNSERYVQPSGDEPLDEVEWAVVRALAAIIEKEIREELRADKPKDRSE